MNKYLTLRKKGYNVKQINQILKSIEQGFDISNFITPEMEYYNIRILRNALICSLKK